ILSMADARTLGIAETICASGMLVSSLYLGIRGIKAGYVRILSLSLALAGACILGFGILESVVFITLFGFGFFMMLPFANNCLDVLVRTNTPIELQGRVWGIVGFMSQIGYVIAYGSSGMLADWIAAYGGISVGRGAGMVISFAGVGLMLVSVSILFLKDIKLLEKNPEEGKEEKNYDGKTFVE
ncbi:MAG: MFS transporter, partial [Anaerovoracaceae bacterium]